MACYFFVPGPIYPGEYINSFIQQQSEYIYPNLYTVWSKFLSPVVGSQNIPLVLPSRNSQEANVEAENPPMRQQQQLLLPRNVREKNNKNKNKKKKKKRGVDRQKQIVSAKKNCESNLINNFFSYFCSNQGSQLIVQAIIKSMNLGLSLNQKLEHLFFATINTINRRRGRKYINKSIIEKMGSPQQLLSMVPETAQKLSKMNNQISIKMICELFRRCSNNFFKTTSLSGILTSRRIKIISKSYHLKRRRRIIGILQQKDSE